MSHPALQREPFCTWNAKRTWRDVRIESEIRVEDEINRTMRICWFTSSFFTAVPSERGQVALLMLRGIRFLPLQAQAAQSELLQR